MQYDRVTKGCKLEAITIISRVNMIVLNLFSCVKSNTISGACDEECSGPMAAHCPPCATNLLWRTSNCLKALLAAMVIRISAHSDSLKRFYISSVHIHNIPFIKMLKLGYCEHY